MDIADDLLRPAKKRVADDGVPLRDIVEDALRAFLSKQTKNTGYRLNWTVDHGTWPPAVDIDDRKALYDFLDGID